MFYGNGYFIAPNSKYDDGLLNVYYAKNINKLKLPNLIFKIKKGKHLNSKYLDHFKTKEITIELDEETVCNMDGEELKSKTFNIKILPKAITIYHNKELIEKVLN